MSDLTDYSSVERIWLCIRIAKWSCDQLTEDADLAKKIIIFSDETHFNLGGYVNKKNCCIWGTKCSHVYLEKLSHPKRVTFWCGFWSRGIIGSFFSKMTKERPLQSMVIVIGPCWTNFFAKIEEEDIGNIWFQQDGATCLTAEATLEVLRPVFEDRIISRRADVVWTIICGVLTKITVTPINQRQLTL